MTKEVAKVKLSERYGVLDGDADFIDLWFSRRELDKIMTYPRISWGEVHRVLQEIRGIKGKVTLEKMILTYGPTEGRNRFEAYRKKQSLTNTFEYKKERFGWSRETFDAFNLSRAVTLENMITKYGKKEGTQRFEQYRKKQAFTNGIEYLGEKYYEVNAKKAHTIENYRKRYGVDAEQKLQDFYRNLTGRSYSKISQELFFSISRNIKEKTYFAENNGEYVVIDNATGKVFKYDFVCYDLRACIEFHGDYFHGNPNMYEANDIIAHGVRAGDKWIFDYMKTEAIKRLRSIETLVVWESEYRSSPEKTEERIMKWLLSRRKALSLLKN